MSTAHRIGIALAVVLTMILTSLVGGQQDNSATQAYGICQNGHYLSQDLLIVCTGDGYYRATNDGWEQMPSPDGGHLSVSLAGVIYHYRGASTEIQRSLDSGKTWELVGTFPSPTRVPSDGCPLPLLPIRSSWACHTNFPRSGR